MDSRNPKQKLFSKKWLTPFIVILLVLIGLSGSPTIVASQDSVSGPVALVTIEPRRVEWQPLVENDGLVLTIAAPGGTIYRQEYAPGEVPVLKLTDASGGRRIDGVYTYELVAIPVLDEEMQAELEAARTSGEGVTIISRQVQSGHFGIKDGVFVVGASEADDAGAVCDELPADPAAPADVLHYDDVIITGSLCVGFDCVNGESFGYCTQKYKENNLQVCFEDTSIGTFPTNDWKIQINDTTSGGASYFTIWDTTGGRRPFTIEAGAPAHSLYVEDYGRVGLGTSIPYVELHIVDGDSPTIRLDQDGSSGWTAQRWDIVGNETNFFVRDVTNGSKLSFRIQPGTPSNTLSLRSTGYVGIGTWSPAYNLEVEATGANAQIAVDRTDGATAKFAALTNKTVIGSVTNHPTRIIANNVMVAEFEIDGDLSINGYLHEGSDVNSKEGFATVDGQDVLARLDGVSISTWSFKASEDGARHMGPMAQDFYAAYGLGSDDKHISALDVGGVALAAIQSLNVVVKEKDAQIQALQEQNTELETRLTALEQAVGLQPESQISFLSLLPWLLVGVLLVGIGMMGGILLTMRKRSYAEKA
jgi:hypothetical protein